MTDTTDWRAEAERLRGERDELKTDLAESDAVRDQLADLLHRTAIALRGPEPELTRWSLHDVPERVAAAIAALGGAVRKLREERDAALAELERAREVLEVAEWSRTAESCPWCLRGIDEGHAPDCKLSAALAAKGE